MVYTKANQSTPRPPGNTRLDKALRLRKALSLMKGLTFESTYLLFKSPDGILVPFVKAAFDKATPEAIHDAITTQLRKLFLICIRNKDVYVRFRGSEAFYYLVFSDWDSVTLASPLEPVLLGKLISLFVGARRRYLAREDSTEEFSALTRVIDLFTEAIDEVDSTIETRRIPSLKAPEDFVITRSWPPEFFSQYDIAIMAQTKIRKNLFGIDYQCKGSGEDAPLYPHDQSHPLEVRRYLCWLSLTEMNPYSKGALFLAPIAFISHQKRQEWYAPTGHKSRFYATVDEFLNYAKVEFARTGRGAKQYIIGLLTPWFFEVAEVTSDAEKMNEDIPTRWQKGCFRAGMVLCLSKLGRQGGGQVGRQSGHWWYQLALFKPGMPHYPAAAEPDRRKKRQNLWIRKLLDEIKAHFHIDKGWIGGRSMNHIEAPASRKVSADSVEVSNEFITEIMENPNCFPITRPEHEERKFETMDCGSDDNSTSR
ncbi:uncharacterized protein F4812DRAFT_458135 [Daldinia caldariorum]|uniref:uncharacterized protein n=1 Tax=Daldinia caldariorum TaxID=326644 RepID=UPI0020078EF9|nr:uncharacterized protein F4812DRAFT_458135 [Daldinia caldariorum]KAI1468607.1 hypothetical protein F4812DRAFT_458135 [Daldinia caldariorum]